jgi:hypothetical protein
MRPPRTPFSLYPLPQCPRGARTLNMFRGTTQRGRNDHRSCTEQRLSEGGTITDHVQNHDSAREERPTLPIPFLRTSGSQGMGPPRTLSFTYTFPQRPRGTVALIMLRGHDSAREERSPIMYRTTTQRAATKEHRILLEATTQRGRNDRSCPIPSLRTSGSQNLSLKGNVEHHNRFLSIIQKFHD